MRLLCSLLFAMVLLSFIKTVHCLKSMMFVCFSFFYPNTNPENRHYTLARGCYRWSTHYFLNLKGASVIYKAIKGLSTFTWLLSLKKEILSFHLSVCTCFSFSSLPFLVHAPGAVQELEEEHNGYPSEAEADQVASSTCSCL